MGCSSSQVSETSHTIIKGTLQKNISVSTSYNPNKYLSLNPIYYKNQAPSIPFNDNIFPPNLDSYYGKKEGKFIDSNEKRRNNSITPIEIKDNQIEYKHYYEIWGDNSDIFCNNNVSIRHRKPDRNGAERKGHNGGPGAEGA